MFKEIALLHAERSKEECVWIGNLRKSSRHQLLQESIKFRRYLPFEEAVINNSCIFNSSSGHLDVLFRLQGMHRIPDPQ